MDTNYEEVISIHLININKNEVRMRALIVVDMQEDYIGENSKYLYEKEKIITNINMRIAEYYANKDSVIYIKNLKVRRQENYVSEFVRELNVVSDIVIIKDKSSCFSNPILLDYLKEHSINDIEVVGIDGNCCVKSTASDAVKSGYFASINENCVGVLNKQRFIQSKDKMLKLGVSIL